MMSPKEKAELDHAHALICEVVPSQWRRMFCRLLEEGFTETQALSLLKMYIKSTCSLNK